MLRPSLERMCPGPWMRNGFMTGAGEGPQLLQLVVVKQKVETRLCFCSDHMNASAAVPACHMCSRVESCLANRNQITRLKNELLSRSFFFHLMRACLGYLTKYGADVKHLTHLLSPINQPVCCPKTFCHSATGGQLPLLPCQLSSPTPRINWRHDTTWRRHSYHSLTYVLKYVCNPYCVSFRVLAAAFPTYSPAFGSATDCTPHSY